MKTQGKEQKTIRFIVIDEGGSNPLKKKTFDSIDEGYSWISNRIPRKLQDIYFVVEQNRGGRV